MAEDRLTVDVVVEVPRNDYNRYVYDEKAKGVRLAEVVYASQRYPADWGIIPKTLGSDGLPLSVLLIANQPTFPGCLVAARPVGLIELETSNGLEQKVVAVGEIDPHFATARNVTDLPSYRLKEIETFLDNQRDGEPSTTLIWRGGEEARAFVLNALQAARLAEVEIGRTRRVDPAWKALFGPGRDGRSAKETDANTAAERAVHVLPYRFQKYVADCLVPQERILFYILRPALSYGGVPFLRRRQANEGLLVITDQQLLFMTDSLPPNSTYGQWGYVARVVALERLQAARVTPASPYPRLEVEVEASGGTEHLSFDFPTEALDPLGQAVDLLRAFIPTPDDLRVRRLPTIAEDKPSLDRRDDEFGPAELVQRLEEQLKTHLVEGEHVLREALAPARPEKRLAARLLVLSEERLFVVSDKDTAPQIYHLGDISSAELSKSLLGSRLEIAVPLDGVVRRLVADFDALSVDRFTRFFLAIRQLLATPTMWAARESAQVAM